ncbi:hypothetical protein ACFQ9D_01720 [Arthrobacter koreensis]|uniref:hypothetical protein n=1 Tax=Arthrobacter koreensis TaxID=199136 RepID=UPI0036399DCD
METSILIALISALGLIITSLFQWQSNKATLRESSKRESQVQAQNERDRKLERDHALTLAQQEREYEMERIRVDRKTLLSDRWLEKRDDAYESALNAAKCVLSAASRCMAAVVSKNGAKLLDNNSEFAHAIDSFMQDTSSVELYGSETTNKAMSEFGNEARFFAVYMSQLQEKLGSGIPLEVDEPASALRMQQGILERFDDFRRAAKGDLGTLE